MARHLELDQKSRNELVEEARELGVERPERMTKVELADEIVRRTTPAEELAEARGLFGVARSMIASVVESGLNLPDAASMIRGNVTARIPVNNQTPVATVTLAEIYAAQGHKSRALRMLDEVLAQEPDHQEAQRVRAALVKGELENASPGVLGQQAKTAGDEITQPVVRVEETGATPDYVPGGFVDTTGEEIQTGKPPAVAVEDSLPNFSAAELAAQALAAAAASAPQASVTNSVEMDTAVQVDSAAEDSAVEGSIDAQTESAQTTASEVAVADSTVAEPALAEVATSDVSAAEAPPSESSVSAPVAHVEAAPETSAVSLDGVQGQPSEISSAAEPVESVAEVSSSAATTAEVEAAVAVGEAVEAEPARLVLSRAGGTLQMYWELPTSVLTHCDIDPAQGSGCVRIVAFTPAGSSPKRLDLTIPLSDGEAISSHAGRNTLGGFDDQAIIRAAVGWIVDEDFLPLAVGKTVEQLRAEGDQSLVGRAETHLLERAAF